MNSGHEQESYKEWGDSGGLCRVGGIAALLLIIYSLAMMVQMVILAAGVSSNLCKRSG
jgi:hypothetical protein